MSKRWAAAIGSALIAMVSLWLYARGLARDTGGGNKIAVLVAAAELAAGARLDKAQLAIQEIPEAYVHAAAVRRGEEAQLVGNVLVHRMERGQPLLWSDVEVARSAAARRLAAEVQKGQRALTLPVDLSGSLAGMLHAGDHGDLLGTFARAQGTDFATVTLLQNVLVLATGSVRAAGELDGGTGQGGSRSFSSVTVQVDLEAAELLAFARERGPINVALRAPGDAETLEDVPDKNFGDIFESARRAAFLRRHRQKIEPLRAQ
jgi:pilus assembly protein CpaB